MYFVIKSSFTLLYTLLFSRILYRSTTMSIVRNYFAYKFVPSNLLSLK